MYDLIIIGGGPAGMSAAIYAVRQKLNFILLTREFGGQMTKKEVEIENYPGAGKIAAQDLINRFREHLKLLGVEAVIGEAARLEKIEGGFGLSTEKGKYEAKSVIIATGAAPRFLNVPGEKEMIGRGVGYCVTCDGPLFSNRNVAVVGGGNAAFESVIFLTKFAKKIYILEAGPEVRADASNIEQAKASGKVEIITNAKVLRIEGERFVKDIVYRDAAGSEIKLDVEGVFVKAGNQPASGFAAGLVDLNDRNEIMFNHETYQTKTPGLFVAGDVSNIKYKQIIIAAGEGAKACLAAEEFLKRLSVQSNK